MVNCEDLAEIGIPALELQIPHLYGIFQSELLALYLGERGEHVGAAEKNLALVADACSREKVFGDVHQIIIGNFRAFLIGVPFADLDVFTGHPPYATGKPREHTVFAGVFHHVLSTEQESILHGKTHVEYAVFLLVAEGPIHLFLRNFIERALLDLNHEVLAILLVGHGDIVESPGLNIKLATGFTHSHESSAGGNFGKPERLLGRGVHITVHRIHTRHICRAVFTAYAKCEVGNVISRIGFAVCIGNTFHSDNTYRIVQSKHVYIINFQHDARTAYLLFDLFFQRAFRLAGADIVILYFEAAAVGAFGITAYLVEWGRHGSYLDDTLVHLVHVEIRVSVRASGTFRCNTGIRLTAAVPRGSAFGFSRIREVRRCSHYRPVYRTYEYSDYAHR